MKKNDIYEEIGNISPDLIAEADPLLPKVTRKTKIRRAISAVAACFVLLIASSCLWLFVPYSIEVPKGLVNEQGNEFFDVYMSIYKYNLEKNNTPSNNYEKFLKSKVWSFFYKLHKYEAKIGIAVDVSSGTSQPKSGYVEVTDIQVPGIIEPDTFKRTQSHLFYIVDDWPEYYIYSYTIEGSESKLCGIFDGSNNTDVTSRMKLHYHYLFLSEDGKTLYVFATESKKTIILIIDVSDPSNMVQKGYVKLNGLPIISRLKDGKLIIGYREKIELSSSSGNEDINDVCPGNIEIYYSNRYYTEAYNRDDVYLPDQITQSDYLDFVQFDLETMKVDDKISLVSCTSNLLTVFDDKILIGTQIDEAKYTLIGTYPHYVYDSGTQFTALSYGDAGFEVIGTTYFDGVVPNNYGVDIDGDILRVVLTSKKAFRNQITREITKNEVSCEIICYDLKKDKMIASVKNFAPADEDVKSARFDEDILYVCTAKEVNEVFTDPVYYFDLSDYQNITSIDTGEIEGFSRWLKPFGDGLLLGIGYADNARTLKVEIYSEEGQSVDPICSYKKERILFSSSYLTYMLDLENGYIGIVFKDSNREIDYSDGYVLLHFDGDNINVIVEEYFNRELGKKEAIRSTVIDGYLYIMFNTEFRVIKLP